MIMQDRLEKERCDAKNAVEEYVYDMRDKLCGPFEEFSKEVVKFLFSQTENIKQPLWLCITLLNGEPSGSVVGLWIVRQVAIRSDPRFMSYDSQIELRVTG